MNNAQMQDTMRTLNLVNEENSDEDDENSDDEVHLTKDASRHLKKDFKNVMFLVFLYLLQGIPLGLTSSLPLLLSSRKVSYSDQGKFSFAFYPFSMKLLWAPVVDSIFVRSFGRRKSWLIPVQYLIGVFLILFSNYVHTLLEVDGNDANIHNGESTQLYFIFY
jgi:PAT family acetyl-CoA transporter-like MFS transporter 1